MIIRKAAIKNGTIVKVKIDSSGNIKTTVVGHTGKASCKTIDNEALINELLAIEIPEFGRTAIEKSEAIAPPESDEEIQDFAIPVAPTKTIPMEGIKSTSPQKQQVGI
jgi:hypothetical protein